MSTTTNPSTATKIDQLRNAAFEAINQAVDAMKFDEEALDQVLARVEELKAVVVAQVGELAKPKPKFVHDRTNDGWELIEDVGFVPPLTSPAQLELVSFLEKGESYVTGEVMAKRATELKAALGQQHAEWLLAHQSEIPQEFRKYYLIFPGTIWRDSAGDRNVPYLCWSSVRWVLCFRWLGRSNWRDLGRLLRPRE